MILLSDEEIIKVINSCEGTVKEARHEVNKAQAMKIVEWGEERCEEHHHGVYKRRHCIQCWQAIKEEIYH